MSITRDQLILYIEKPHLLKEQSIGELKEIVDEFPYFQSAQLLYTYNLHAQANFRYDSYLKTCSIFTTDRSVLYRLLQPKLNASKSQKQVTPVENRDPDSDTLFELSEENQITNDEFHQFSPVGSADNETVDLDLLSFDQSDSTYQFIDSETAHNHSDNPQPEENGLKAEEKIDLIEQFIKINPTIQPRIEIPTERNDLFELKDDSENENDEFITETLSRIYLKQGHYQKAIDSFRRLSLKFPEKSVYFAQQIEEIKKLLN